MKGAALLMCVKSAFFIPLQCAQLDKEKPPDQ